MLAKQLLARLKSGDLKLSCHDPDNPVNWPRNMFVWRSNILGSSGKGHEYFLKHLLGTSHGVQGKDLGQTGEQKPRDVVWHDDAPEGKLDLLGYTWISECPLLACIQISFCQPQLGTKNMI